jgi:hypothetical protein
MLLWRWMEECTLMGKRCGTNLKVNFCGGSVMNGLVAQNGRNFRTDEFSLVLAWIQGIVSSPNSS